ncbi:hypothetical protein PG997_010512 [Apiospora hydei]|uniref:C2H2-type domain-containing protein n=1 Tax=Apiospora hydei TaxID=1337664 RepID=A0ABR1VX89_9PEZI
MDLDTVGDLVTALVSTYDDGLECYTRWQRKQGQANHYRGHSRRGQVSDSGSCGLSTSLMVSASRLRQVYDSGVDVLGDTFSTGDSKTHRHHQQCRGSLQASLEMLQAHVEALHSAARRDNAPLGLFEMIRASEAARISSLRALAEQYQRVAVGRLVPSELPIRQPPPRRPSAEPSSPVEIDAETDFAPELAGYDDGAEGRIWNDGCRRHEQHAIPPPCQIATVSATDAQGDSPDDLQSTCTSEFGPRPRASVFSVFCPEAMKYQVDLQKATPLSSSSSSLSAFHRKRDTCCSQCGYRWNGNGNDGGDSRDPMSSSNNRKKAAFATTIKDGFQLTPRFLGKSHCGTGGFGCVLCTSSGRTDVYESVERLRDHINASHDKWQMLHERDMVNC